MISFVLFPKHQSQAWKNITGLNLSNMKQDMIQLVIQKQAQKRSWKEDFQEKTPAGGRWEF